MSAMKKFINAPETLLAESLDGFAAAHADILTLGPERKFLRRRRLKPGKVALISGGGSGHEPLHAGFVGEGMLDAACPGEIFTSPTPDRILAAAEDVAGEAGVLFIVKNYAGDRMNFEMAAEMAACRTATVITDDDVAVENSTHTAGRRGVAGTLVVEKIIGAAAEKGAGLETCAALGIAGQCRDALDGGGADELHRAGRGHAHLCARRGRDGDGRGHPWRTGTAPGAASRTPMPSPGR